MQILNGLLSDPSKFKKKNSIFLESLQKNELAVRKKMTKNRIIRRNRA